MLIKLNILFPVLTRRKEEVEHKELTRQQWINADRIIIIALFLSVIIGAIVFS